MEQPGEGFAFHDVEDRAMKQRGEGLGAAVQAGDHKARCAQVVVAGEEERMS